MPDEVVWHEPPALVPGVGWRSVASAAGTSPSADPAAVHARSLTWVTPYLRASCCWVQDPDSDNASASVTFSSVRGAGRPDLVTTRAVPPRRNAVRTPGSVPGLNPNASATSLTGNPTWVSVTMPMLRIPCHHGHTGQTAPSSRSRPLPPARRLACTPSAPGTVSAGTLAPVTRRAVAGLNGSWSWYAARPPKRRWCISMRRGCGCGSSCAGCTRRRPGSTHCSPCTQAWPRRRGPALSSTRVGMSSRVVVSTPTFDFSILKRPWHGALSLNGSARPTSCGIMVTPMRTDYVGGCPCSASSSMTMGLPPAGRSPQWDSCHCATSAPLYADLSGVDFDGQDHDAEVICGMREKPPICSDATKKAVDGPVADHHQQRVTLA